MVEKRVGSKSGRGPKNIMNDLDYKTWMKFQKSFERYEFGEDNYPKNFQDYVVDFIRFFTKRKRNKEPTAILTNIEGVSDVDGRKILTVFGNPADKVWKNEIRSSGVNNFDYVILIMGNIKDIEDPDANELFAFLSSLLKTNAYTTLFCIEPQKIYPYIWVFANACRNHLLLCDEKLFLDSEKERQPIYALQFRKSKDIIPKKPFKHIIKTKLFDSPAYIIPHPPPRKRDEFKHPAKFPEELAGKLIANFTDEEDWVLDVMVGTGSTLIAAYQTKRNGVGIELSEEYYNITKKRVEKVNPLVRLPGFEQPYKSKLCLGDARDVNALLSEKAGQIRYCITSPPYWNMLKNHGSEGQRKRRQRGLKLTYSDDKKDLGNITNYQHFMQTLVEIYEKTAAVLTDDGKLTVIVKNVKQEGHLYTLAWDLVDVLAGPNGKYEYIGYTLWCQDDVNLKPFAIGHHWVSNTFHQYCLHFQVRL